MRKGSEKTPSGTRQKTVTKILLTGASGFVGRALLPRLIDRGGYHMTVLTRKPDLIPQHPKIKVLSCDLTNLKSLTTHQRVIQSCDVICHLASLIPQERGFDDDFALFYQKNVEMILNLLKVGRPKHIIYTSSCDVYGFPQSIPVKEDHSLNPNTVYALSKMIGEELLNSYGRQSRIPVTILRLANVYGPYDQRVKIIPRVIDKVFRNERPLLFGDGKDTRDYIFIEDVIDAIIAAFIRKRSGTYNIATGKETSIREAIANIIRESSRMVRPLQLPRKKPKVRLLFDVSKAKKDLRFKAGTPFKEGIRRTVQEEQPLLIFDVDGTLLDTRKRYYALYRDLLPSKKPLSENAYWALKKNRIKEDEIAKRSCSNRQLLKKYHVDRLRWIENNRYLALDHLFPWSKRLLKTLRKNYAVILVSLRQNDRNFQKQIRQLGLGALCHKAISVPPHLLGSPAATKAHGIRHLTGKPLALVGDTESDIQAAHLLGIPGYGVLTGIRNQPQLLRSKPTAILRDARDVRQHLYHLDTPRKKIS